MGRCNCPQYSIPSADPNDSRGCPVHDPAYVDPNEEIRRLKAHIADHVEFSEEDADLMHAALLVYGRQNLGDERVWSLIGRLSEVRGSNS